MLHTAFALADEAAGRSDGVGYAIAIRTNGGQIPVHVLERQVLGNSWDMEVLDLSAYLDQDLLITVTSSSLGHEDYDWLQMTLQLIATRGRAHDRSRDG